MGSVIDFTECPHCKQEAHTDFYYKTGEEYLVCMHCGYYKSYTIKNRDKKIDELTDDDWEIKEIANPFGSYRIKSKGSIGVQCGCLEDEASYKELEDAIAENSSEIEFCSVSRFINGEIKLEYLIQSDDGK
jgi:Zn ribbon nucleic-acid-binding protein